MVYGCVKGVGGGAAKEDALQKYCCSPGRRQKATVGQVDDIV